MTHPILALQAGLVAALRASPALAGVPIADAPPRGSPPPWLAIARHDLLPRDGDLAPGFEHRISLEAWVASPSRKAALELIEAATEVALGLGTAGGLRLTHGFVDRTDSAVDAELGVARAVLGLRLFSEWVG